MRSVHKPCRLGEAAVLLEVALPQPLHLGAQIAVVGRGESLWRA
jgi:hypothetical protein